MKSLLVSAIALSIASSAMAATTTKKFNKVSTKSAKAVKIAALNTNKAAEIATAAPAEVTAAPSPIRVQVVTNNEFVDSAIKNNEMTFESLNEIKITYKMSDTSSFRIRPAFISKINDSESEETVLDDVYVQYSYSGIAANTVMPMTSIFRAYLPTSEASRDAGQHAQLRAYLTADIALTPAQTLTWTLSPRAWLGNQDYVDLETNKSARMFSLLEYNLDLNSIFSFYQAAGVQSTWNQVDAQLNQAFYQTHLTTNFTENFKIETGLYAFNDFKEKANVYSPAVNTYFVYGYFTF